MKNMKKAISVMLILFLTLTMGLPAFADETEKGSITINGVSTDTTYEIYRLLDLESYSTEGKGAYSYKANSSWTNFFATEAVKAYFTTSETGYVTWIWKATETDTRTEDEAIADFAKEALAFAKTHNIDPVKSSKNAGEFVITDNVGKFSALELGYYLVDSTMGALCGLTTTNPDASINAKNGIPTIDKQVQEDSTSQWGNTNTADIGQIVNYRVTINVHAGAENYVLHDTMGDGLTFQQVTKVEHVIPGTETHDTEISKYDVKTNTSEVEDGCTFEVHFTKDLCDKLETNDKLIIYYTAMLNRNAEIAGEGNKNTAWLTFGEGGESTEDEVTTYTYGIDIVKTDSQNTLINGAEFKIYDAQTGGNEVAVVLMDDGVTYRRARADETGGSIVVKDGKVRVVGFDNGTYYLEETEAPDGYNKLTARQKFIISDGNLDAIFNGDIYSTGSGVHVVNKTGSMLPETGGMGTVMFVTCGMIVVLGAGVLLVTKKRMSMIQ
ncbi:MAG: SpaH/EbpB family LPXTG-anchored major pilin [Peptococcaceae bacterium]|nr:SpaH/EbpB family LPXTG-anchored major pilin [Peptococcaceae bacterium]